MSYALWCAGGFAGTHVTTQYAILCFTPSLVAACLLYWSACKRGDWSVLWAFCLGCAVQGAVIYLQVTAAMRLID